MKGVLKRSMALLLSAMMSMGILVTAMPKKESAVNAAGANKAVAFGKDMEAVLKTNVNTEDSQIIYFGAEKKDLIPWNVVGYNGTGVAGDSNSGCMTLLERRLCPDNVQFAKSEDSRPYAASNLRTYIENWYSTNFWGYEKSAVAPRDLEDNGGFAENAYVWPLSLEEASALNTSLRFIQYSETSSMPNGWWLRTAKSLTYQKYIPQSAYVMWEDGPEHFTTTSNLHARPAMNVDLSKVAFISAAKNGKPSYKANELQKVPSYSGNEWKMTVFSDSNTYFSAKNEGPSVVYVGEPMQISVRHAFDGDNALISAFLVDASGNLLRYGCLAKGTFQGTVSLTIPKDLKMGDYTLKVFSELRMSDRATDMCSQFVDIPITVCEHNANIVIDLSTGSAVPENNYINALDVLMTRGLISGSSDSTRVCYDLDKNGISDVEYLYSGSKKSLTKMKNSDFTGRITFSGEQLKGTDYASIAIILPIKKPGTLTGLKATSAGKNMVELTWKPIDGVLGYLIYAQKDNKYAYVGMTSSTRFLDTKALDTDYNYYWVFGYICDSQSNMVPGGCEKYVYAKGVCPAVTGLKASSVTGGVKLSWNASLGADGYLIYGIHPGGSYEYIGMTTSGTTFTDKKASNTDWNFYWVYPYHKNDSTMVVGGTPDYVYGKAK